MSYFNNQFMKAALNEAKLAFERNEVPVGAVIVDSITNKIIARAGNQIEADNDSTAHAELIVLKKAFQIIGNSRLNDCYLYVTLEPCPMCAQAISFARIKRLYFGAYDPKGGGVEHGARIFSASSCHFVPEIYGGICEQESSLLLKEFFKKLR